MGSADVAMDYEVVGKMADILKTSSDVLKVVSKALEIASSILKASAMFGNVGALALAFYLDNIKSKCDPLAETCAQMSEGCKGAIMALRDQDFTGSQLFV